MNKPTPLALAPLALFLLFFVGSGLWYQSQAVEYAFYQISAPVAILPAIVLAVLLARGPLNERIQTFIRGVGDDTIITMVLIYLLAGGFASVAKAVGGVDATVNFGLSVIPAELVLPGLFVITAFVATAMGTSMGTIAAIAPIAVGVAQATELSLLLTTATVVGGAMFGDNLSIISDTTIAATRTQGCAMRDKFRLNFRIALPAALLTLVWLWWQSSTAVIEAPGDYELIRVLPYLAVLVLAVLGVNVMLVLFVGILLAGGIGLALEPAYTLAQWSKDIYAGYGSMQEILILSLLIGGLGAMMKSQGGLAWLSGRHRPYQSSGQGRAGAAQRGVQHCRGGGADQCLYRQQHGGDSAGRFSGEGYRPAPRGGCAPQRQSDRHLLLRGAGDAALWRSAAAGGLHRRAVAAAAGGQYPLLLAAGRLRLAVHGDRLAEARLNRVTRP